MKVFIQLKIEKDTQRISDAHILKSFYDFITLLQRADSLQDVSRIKKISGEKSYYRYRIRDYRVGFRYIHGEIYIERFLHRKDIYKVFP